MNLSVSTNHTYFTGIPGSFDTILTDATLTATVHGETTARQFLITTSSCVVYSKGHGVEQLAVVLWVVAQDKPERVENTEASTEAEIKMTRYALSYPARTHLNR